MAKYAKKATVNKKTGRVMRKDGYLYFVDKKGKVMETKLKQHR